MAVPDPTSFLYRVNSGAWEAVVGTDGFTDTSAPTYGGSGDDEYAAYDGTDDFTEVDTPPDMTGFGFANDFSIAIRFRAPSGTLDEEQYLLGMGIASGGASKVYISMNTDGTITCRVDAGSENRQLSTVSSYNDGADHVVAFTHDSTLDNLNIYIDDAADGNSSTSGLSDDTSELEHMVIGAEPVGTIGDAGFWSDRIYWIAGWDDTFLSTSERAELDDSSWPFDIPSAGGSSILPLLNAYYG